MTPEAAAETAALIADLWQRHLPALRERLDTLDSIAASSAAGSMSDQQREEGIMISHKLAGSLGMYGYQHGTEVALQLEQLLRSNQLAQPDQVTELTISLRQSIFPTT